MHLVNDNIKITTTAIIIKVFFIVFFYRLSNFWIFYSRYFGFLFLIITGILTSQKTAVNEN
jgi:hypothetical protein